MILLIWIPPFSSLTTISKLVTPSNKPLNWMVSSVILNLSWLSPLLHNSSPFIFKHTCSEFLNYLRQILMTDWINLSSISDWKILNSVPLCAALLLDNQYGDMRLHHSVMEWLYQMQELVYTHLYLVKIWCHHRCLLEILCKQIWHCPRLNMPSPNWIPDSCQSNPYWSNPRTDNPQILRNCV